MKKRLTVNEVAELFQLSAYTVREYARHGRIVGTERAGNRWRFIADEVRLVEPEVPADPMGKGADYVARLRRAGMLK